MNQVWVYNAIFLCHAPPLRCWLSIGENVNFVILRCKGSEKNADKQILCVKREFIPYVCDGYGSCKGAE